VKRLSPRFSDVFYSHQYDTKLQYHHQEIKVFKDIIACFQENRPLETALFPTKRKLAPPSHIDVEEGARV